jgi:hypothetical protein
MEEEAITIYETIKQENRDFEIPFEELNEAFRRGTSFISDEIINFTFHRIRALFLEQNIAVLSTYFYVRRGLYEYGDYIVIPIG